MTPTIHRVVSFKTSRFPSLSTRQTDGRPPRILGFRSAALHRIAKAADHHEASTGRGPIAICGTCLVPAWGARSAVIGIIRTRGLQVK